jgi:hypothetical protein
VEQSLGKQQTVTLSYVASVARNLLTTQVENVPPRDPLTGAVLPPPNSNFGAIIYTNNGATSDYHSLQAQYQRRLTRGLQALVNYTWSHAIDEVSDERQTGTLERGNAAFDVRHNFTAAVTYDIPKLSAGPILTSLLRGWSVDSTIYAQSGVPLNLVAGRMFRGDGRLVIVRPDVVPGVPFWIDDPNAPGGQKINVAAFAAPPRIPGSFFLSRQGTLGRNVVREPGRFQVNMAVRRQFNLTERINLQLKAEAFNLFNHPIFSSYSTFFTTGSSTFGKPTRTLNRSLSGLSSLYQMGGPRSMQFSVRLGF